MILEFFFMFKVYTEFDSSAISYSWFYKFLRKFNNTFYLNINDVTINNHTVQRKA